MAEKKSPAEQVSEWAETARTAIEKRDDAIRAMAETGASFTAIATAAGMTRQGVAKILKREPNS